MFIINSILGISNDGIFMEKTNTIKSQRTKQIWRGIQNMLKNKKS